MESTERNLLWAMLPDGLEEYFEIEDYRKTNEIFQIILKEKNILPEIIPEEYSGKTVVNTVTQPITVDYFPIKGRKTVITLKRRLWKFAGVERMLKRDIRITADGTRLEKEFAAFLKEFDRE